MTFVSAEGATSRKHLKLKAAAIAGFPYTAECSPNIITFPGALTMKDSVDSGMIWLSSYRCEKNGKQSEKIKKEKKKKKTAKPLRTAAKKKTSLNN